MSRTVYEVHDEDGVLRRFWFKDQADRFAGSDYRVVVTKEPRYKRPRFDIDKLPDAPF